jgi:hypothetical protein
MLAFVLSLTESLQPPNSVSRLGAVTTEMHLIRYFQPCKESLQGVWVWRGGALV